MNQFSNRSLAVFIGFCVLGGACGQERSPEAAEPVFAIERNVVRDVEPLALIDPTAQIPAGDLRLLLQGLLTEHVQLSIEAMRLAIDGRDMTATVEQLTANTDGLTQAIGLIYGRDGAFAFDQLWTNHIEFFNRYGAALRTGEQAQLESVRLEFGHYETDFSSYIEAATAGELDLRTVEHILHSHVRQLLDQADAWAEGRYDDAYAIQLEAHDHGDVIAETLATGFAAQNPDLFPGVVASAANSQCAAAHLRASAALYFDAEAALVERSGVTARLMAVVDAAAAARAAADETVMTTGVVDRSIASFRSDSSSNDDAMLYGIPAARQTAAAQLATELSDDCA